MSAIGTDVEAEARGGRTKRRAASITGDSVGVDSHMWIGCLPNDSMNAVAVSSKANIGKLETCRSCASATGCRPMLRIFAAV